MTLRVRYAVRSDRGLVRGNNEDSVYAGPRLLAIADGMGGHAGGEVASQVVIGSIERLDEDRPLDDLIVAMRDAVEDANRLVAESVAREPQLDGMGTTLTALRFVDARVGVMHVGDSRAYLLRDGELTQITRDDTYVQSLVEAGRITAEEATTHPRKSVILQAMTGAEVVPDLSIREVRPGDRYLLCTDGLSDVVSDRTLRESLLEGTPQECADQLVALALRGGGPDNVTCVVALVTDDGYGDDLPVVAGAVGGEGATPSAGLADSPAGRASAARALAERDPAAPEPDAGSEGGAGGGRRSDRTARQRRHRRRMLLALFLLCLAVIASIGALYRWTQQQYYVGERGGAVVIFRGLPTEVGPWALSSVVEDTGLPLADLTEAARDQVRGRIDATSRADAAQIVARLADSLLPLCPTTDPGLAISSAPSGNPGPEVSEDPAEIPTGTDPAEPTGEVGSVDAGLPTLTAGPSPSHTSTHPAAPVPGVDCRLS
ncbi:MAG: protein phosphatase 2C domain-containing protein [Frankiaceae bacterium]|jgi:protein phosphatase|nr:protein phosphatase 2C domain-containing protein [Frankiaceae bacterium]